MVRSIKWWIFSGLTLCLGATNITAAETVIYQFDNWKVAVVPGRSSREKSQDLTRTKTDAVTVHDMRNRQQPIVQLVSFNQENPAPAPGDLPPLKSTSEAIPKSELPTPLPPTPLVPQSPASVAPVPTEESGLPTISPRSPDVIPSSVTSVPQAALYRDIYLSIPFSRVEYNAYPNYRHDATMEILFNKMRPTILQRSSTHVTSYDPYYGYGYGYGGYWDPPYYPFSYGLRIHRSR